MNKLFIVSSISFYKDVVWCKNQLKDRFEVDMPQLAWEMEKRNNYTLEEFEDFYGENKEEMVSEIIYSHLNKVKESQVLLVVNQTKHGLDGYIGGNVLMEMAMAYGHHIPIYVLNAPSSQLPYFSEIVAMKPTILEGDLTKLTA